jgi:hypothetical protein
MDVPARVEGIRPFLFHGAEWVQLYFCHLDDSETVRSEQFSRDSLPASIKVGDEIVVFYLLGSVASVRLRKIADSADAG